MHPFDDNEMTTLEVIDATLAGEAVEPEYADLAELTLILAGQRPHRASSSLPRSTHASRAASRSAPSVGARRARRCVAVHAGDRVGGRRRGGDRGRDRRWRSRGSHRPLPRRPRRSRPPVRPQGIRGRRCLYRAADAGAVDGQVVVGVQLGGLGQRAGRGASAAGAAGFRARRVNGRDPVAAGGGPAAPSTAGRQVVQSAQLALSTRPEPRRFGRSAGVRRDRHPERRRRELAGHRDQQRQRLRAVPAQRAELEPEPDDGRPVAAARRVRRLADRRDPGHNGPGRRRGPRAR